MNSGFDLRISGVRSNCSANCATTTARQMMSLDECCVCSSCSLAMGSHVGCKMVGKWITTRAIFLQPIFFELRFKFPSVDYRSRFQKCKKNLAIVSTASWVELWSLEISQLNWNNVVAIRSFHSSIILHLHSFFLQYCSHQYWMGSNDY